MSRKRRKKKIKSKTLSRLIILLIVIVLAIIGGIYAYNFYIEKDGLAKYLKIKLNGKKEITIKYNEEFKDEGVKASYKDENLSKKVKTKTDLDSKKIGEYKITYTIKYKKQTKSIYRMVKVIDDIKPEINLVGKSEMTIYKDSKFEEPGAKASDEYDGDISDNISITGTVDTKKVGEYTLTYTIKDSSNNEAVIERKVKVIEKPAPVNNNSNNGNNNSSIPDGVIGKTSKGFTIEKKNGIYYIGGIIIANKSYALPRSYNPGGLLQVFNDNFNEMKAAAGNEGITLNPISDYRSYDKQQSTYNGWVSKYGTSKADTVSARPGHSEHQTGLAADINSLNQSWSETNEGKWLNNNCYKYGFIIRYPRGKESITGYIFEPWHIRYVGKELAEKLYNNGNWITLEEYFGIDSKY